jgi:predicted ribonuclease YlaK
MAATLPWLDAANDDDRLLASFLEVMRQFPHSAVLLVTRDINLQNKAEFANVCFIEPPEPRVP